VPVEVERVTAPNPGPMTLAGTNTYLVGRDPAYVVDPGPDDPRHVAAVRAAGAARGGIGGAVLTHSHADHSGAVAALGAELLWGQVSAGDEASGLVVAQARIPPAQVGPFRAVPTPGHAPDHVAFLVDGACFCGDLVLGEGSSIVPPAAWGGSLTAYMRSLDTVEALGATVLYPGHGPPITDPAAKVAEYRAHRRERERKLIAALEAGERSRGRLLATAWSDVPAPMRPMAALAMQAHLEKIEGEGRLPTDLTD
jgi:glyoxylase-like metal-dependent hydrolase (beta-lactamase superfamily II)